MDFFAHQDAARRASRRLNWTMVVVVAGVVAAIDGVAYLGLQHYYQRGRPLSPAKMQELLLLIAGTVTAIIAIGALVARLRVSGGGRAVAEALGGREIFHTPGNERETRLLNVVEEMAIAAGVPRPPVFVLDDGSINAFAAGFTVDDAAVAVTRGTLDLLDRDQLQGVIGHEFSHILNGDMQLNMRLTATIAGLMTVAEVGRFAMRIAANTRSRRNGNAPIILAGLTLLVIGCIGWFAGRLVQAAFSRQREFLADASAVQFTRNPDGIAGALQAIRNHGSTVAAPHTASFAHQFFAAALTSGFFSLFSTHPPLEERIARIRGGMADPQRSPAAMDGGTAGISSFAGTIPARSVESATATITRLPPLLLAAARSPATARALALLPLLGEDPAAISEVEGRDRILAAELVRLQPYWQRLDADAGRVTLLRLAAPGLKSMSERQKTALLDLAEAVIRHDHALSLREALVLRRLRLDLAAPLPPRAQRRLRDARDAVAVILSALAFAAGDTPALHSRSYAAGWMGLPIPGGMPDLAVTDGATLMHALDEAATLDGAGKRALIDACERAARADGVATVREQELLSLVAGELGVPIPL